MLARLTECVSRHQLNRVMAIRIWFRNRTDDASPPPPRSRSRPRPKQDARSISCLFRRDFKPGLERRAAK